MNTTQTDIIKSLIDYVTEQVEPIDQEAQFDSMLDECYSFEKVGGIFSNMSPSRVLKEVDPTAYRCGINDYFGCNEDLFEIGSDYYDTDEIEKARTEFVDQLESEVTDLENKLEETDEDLVAERGKIERQIQDLKADIEKAEKYTF